MKPLTKIADRIYAVEIPADAVDIEYKKPTNRIRFYTGEMYKDRSGYPYPKWIELPGGNWEILSVVDKDDVDSSVSQLLKDNGIYLKNPLGVVPRKIAYSQSPEEQEYFDSSINKEGIGEWREYQSKVVEKVLIIHKK